MCVGSLDHLDNCKSLESLIYLKACLKMVIFSTYVRRSLPFVSRFTSIVFRPYQLESLFSAGRPLGTRKNSVHCLWFLCCCTQTLHRTPFGTSSYFTHVDVCFGLLITALLCKFRIDINQLI